MRRKATFFMPRKLLRPDVLPALSIISGNYFKVANHLRAGSRVGQGELPGHYFVFASVIMFVAAFEAFCQEHLALSRRGAAESKDPGSLATVELIDSLKSQVPPYNDFKEWVKEIYKRYDRNDVGIDPLSDEYQNLLALKELRNSIIHYNPSFIEYANWPARLEQALHRSKLDVLNAGWVTNFSRPEIADWAHDSTKAVVKLFARLSGAEDPFEVTLERNGVPPWE